MIQNVDSFLEKLQTISPTKQKKQFVKRRTVETIFTNAKSNFGKYQLLPLTSVINDFPFVVLQNTREIKMPRRNVMSDGTEQTYSAWIKLLPKSAYTIKDPSTGREVSSLTAADEELLDQAYQIYEELYKELDVRNKAMDPTIGGLIRRKCYTLVMARVLNYWGLGDSRNPIRQNFSGLLVVTSKGFPDIIGNNISDINLTSGMGDSEWVNDIYNRELSGRKGFLIFSISKSDSPGFSISVQHSLNAGQYLKDVVIPEEDAQIMQNPVKLFLGWQANREDDDVPADQARLFNRNLIREAIDYMTNILAKTRLAKESGTSIEEAIEATNQTVLAHQKPTNAGGVETNDPILADMAREATQQQGQGSWAGGFGGGNNFVTNENSQRIVENNTNPFQNPAASHLDPISGAPMAPDNFGQQQSQEVRKAPFTQPSFASGFGGSGSSEAPF